MNRLGSHISLTFVTLFAVILGGQTTINPNGEGSFQKYLPILNNSYYGASGNSVVSVDKIKSLLQTLPLNTLKEIKAVANKDAELGRRYILKMLPKEYDNISEGTSTSSILKLKSTFIDTLLKDLNRKKQSSFWNGENSTPKVLSQTSSPILLENFEVFQIPSDLFMKSLTTTTEKPEKYLVFDQILPPHGGKTSATATTPQPLDTLSHVIQSHQLLNDDVKIDKTAIVPNNFVGNQQGYEPNNWDEWSKGTPNQQQHYTIHVPPNQNPTPSFHQIFSQQTGNTDVGNSQNPQWNQGWNQNQQNPWPNNPTAAVTYQNAGFPEFSNPGQNTNSLPYIQQQQFQQPFQQSSQPFQQTNQQSSKPFQQTNQQSSQPFQQTNQQSSQPFQQTNQQSSQPFQQTNQPFQQTNQPFQQTNQPYQPASQPYQQTNQPFQNPNQPFQQPNQPIQWPQYYPPQNNYFSSNQYPNYPTMEYQGGWPQSPGWFPQQYSENNYNGWPGQEESEEGSKEKKHGFFHSIHNAVFGDKHKDKHKNKGKYKDDKDKWKYMEENGWKYNNDEMNKWKHKEEEKDKWKLFKLFEDKGKDKGKHKGKGKGTKQEFSYGWDTPDNENTEASDTYADTYNHYSEQAEDWWDKATSKFHSHYDKAKSKFHEHFEKKKAEKNKKSGHHAYTASQKLLGISISILAFLAFAAYILMLLFQTAVTTVTFPLLSGIISLLSGDGGSELIGYLIGRSMDGMICTGNESNIECHVKYGIKMLKDFVLNYS